MSTLNCPALRICSFVISKDISIRFQKTTRTSERIEVVFNGDTVKATLEDTDGLTHRWTLEREIRMFMNLRADDTLTFRVAYGKRRGCFKARSDRFEEFRLAPKDIADNFKQSKEIRFSRPNCSVMLKVATGSIEELIATESSEELNPLLNVQDVITSSSSFLQFAQPLKSVLESIPITADALQVLESAIDTLGNAHPLAKAVLTALSIPYKVRYYQI